MALPRCANKNCIYLSNNRTNLFGKCVFERYCCNACKNNNGHGNRCQRINSRSFKKDGLIPPTLDDTIEKQTEFMMSHKEFFNDINLTYSPIYGLSIYNKNMYTEFIDDNAYIFFRLLNNFNISYGIFAGNSIGYVRKGSNLHWVDDYDILVFDNEIDKVKKLLSSDVFRTNGFYSRPWKRGLGGYQVYNSIKNENSHIFQCDIFFSEIRNNLVYNKDGWGLYHRKAMPKEVVLPFKDVKMGKVEVCIVNNPDEEVRLCYGNIEKGVLYSHKVNTKISVDNWLILDNFFKRKYDEGISNVKAQLPEHAYLNKLNIYRKFERFSVLEVLNKIASSNVKQLNIFNERFLQLYIYDIKFYFPNIIINYYNIYNNVLLEPIYLNKCDNVYFKYQNVLSHYMSDSILYIKKPNMQLLKLITFGTFDLFHKGHTNIFKQCERYSNNIVVGLSSDAFTYEKKQIYPTDNFETRKNNIIKCSDKVFNVFAEEKMELKTDYINTNCANLLLMGDDWKNKFDFVDCAVIYIKRTPDISSTMLRLAAK